MIMDITWLQKAVCRICWTWRISCLFPQRQPCTFVIKSLASPSTSTDTPVLLSSLSVKRKYVQWYPGKRLNILSSTEIRLCMHAFIQLMTSNWAHNYSSPEDNITQNNKMQLINNTGKVLKSKLNARLQKNARENQNIPVLCQNILAWEEHPTSGALKLGKHSPWQSLTSANLGRPAVTAFPVWMQFTRRCINESPDPWLALERQSTMRKGLFLHLPPQI